MQLTEKQKKRLRGLAHPKKPVVYVGKAGISDAVVREVDSALATHELLKVGARVDDRELRDQVLQQLAERTHSALVQRIGNVGIFYRRSKDKPRIILPDG